MEGSGTHISVLLVDVSNLEPDVLFRQRGGGHGSNVSEALRPVSDGHVSSSGWSRTSRLCWYFFCCL
jgi:hypothetical protein